LFTIADTTCQCDPESVLHQLAQNFCSSRKATQAAPESQQDQGQAHVPITTGMKPVFNFNDEQQQRDEERMFSENSCTKF